MEYCCEKFTVEMNMRPNGFTFEPKPYAVKGWCVWGCCGGGCFVLEDIKFCPFCGEELKIPEGK